jgi:hypothetical protein
MVGLYAYRSGVELGSHSAAFIQLFIGKRRA